MRHISSTNFIVLFSFLFSLLAYGQLFSMNSDEGDAGTSGKAKSIGKFCPNLEFRARKKRLQSWAGYLERKEDEIDKKNQVLFQREQEKDERFTEESNRLNQWKGELDRREGTLCQKEQTIALQARKVDARATRLKLKARELKEGANVKKAALDARARELERWSTSLQIMNQAMNVREAYVQSELQRHSLSERIASQLPSDEYPTCSRFRPRSLHEWAHSSSPIGRIRFPSPPPPYSFDPN